MRQVENKKAFFNYQILEKFEAGIALSGEEIKSIREGRVSLADSYAFMKGGEALLVNAHIAPYEKGDQAAEPKKDRRLLLHKKEIDYLIGKLSGQNLTIVPLRLYFRHSYAKIEIALARGKKKADKRETLKLKAIERDVEAGLRAEKLKAQRQEN